MGLGEMHKNVSYDGEEGVALAPGREGRARTAASVFCAGHRYNVRLSLGLSDPHIGQTQRNCCNADSRRFGQGTDLAHTDHRTIEG